MQVKEFLDLYQQGERNFSHIDLAGASLSGVSLRNIDLTGSDLCGANLSWASITHSQFTGAILRRADLRCAALTGTNLNQAILSGANLSKVDLRMASLEEADLNWAVLQEADLTGCDLTDCKLDQINLERAKLNGAKLLRAELMEANLRRASLIGANLTGANLRESHIEEASMREAILVEANLIEANLSGVNLREANLSQADLHRVVLTGADLSEATLDSADLSRANLTGAYLLKTSLKNSHLLRANLQDAYLLRSDLSEASLRGADLRRADLSGAYLRDATLSEADLRDAYLLESRLIRTNVDGAMLTGCCTHNWHLEEVDFSKVDCRYVFTDFNYATKSPKERYPVGRDFEPGELGRHRQVKESVVEVSFPEAPNWQALVFALAQVELESHELTLTVQSFESGQDGYLLKLKANHFVSAKLVAGRILQLYPEMLRRLNARWPEIFRLLNITGQLNNSPPSSAPAPQPPLLPPSPEQPTSGKRQQVYQEVVRQIQYILVNQAPAQFVDSVQRLLDYLKSQGISTEELQKKAIVQVIAHRAKQDPAFGENLVRWQKTATEYARLSMVGEAIRLALAAQG
ncbi:MAG: pentapeptide repeat-containing protein [Oscillatoria sp. Prado101]|jgi:uncharacterized protein YjbI with pentapeptide repeats|nr:pentapeptide repeat-containing protein [Oscillatoria sp. Prado101]